MACASQEITGPAYTIMAISYKVMLLAIIIRDRVERQSVFCKRSKPEPISVAIGARRMQEICHNQRAFCMLTTRLREARVDTIDVSGITHEMTRGVESSRFKAIVACDSVNLPQRFGKPSQ